MVPPSLIIGTKAPILTRHSTESVWSVCVSASVMRQQPAEWTQPDLIFLMFHWHLHFHHFQSLKVCCPEGTSYENVAVDDDKCFNQLAYCSEQVAEPWGTVARERQRHTTWMITPVGDKDSWLCAACCGGRLSEKSDDCCSENDMRMCETINNNKFDLFHLSTDSEEKQD